MKRTTKVATVATIAAPTPVIQSAKHFAELPRAFHYATQCARVSGSRYLVCLRLGRWYALGPEHAKSARGNACWPGRELSKGSQ